MFAGIPKRRCFARGLSGFLDFLSDMSSSCGGKILWKHEVAPERPSTDAGQNKREQPCPSFKTSRRSKIRMALTNFLQVSCPTTTSLTRVLAHPNRQPHENYLQESGSQDSV